jgi:hypothetical protein
MSVELSKFDLLTLADVADVLHCSKAHICKAVAGKVEGCAAIPSITLGRRKLVRRVTLLEWIDQNEKNTLIASPESGARKRA